MLACDAGVTRFQTFHANDLLLSGRADDQGVVFHDQFRRLDITHRLGKPAFGGTEPNAEGEALALGPQVVVIVRG